MEKAILAIDDVALVECVQGQENLCRVEFASKLDECLLFFWEFILEREETEEFSSWAVL